MNPILDKLLASPVLAVANSVISLIKDKTKSPDDSFIHDKVKNGVSISSKRVLNLSGTYSLIGTGIMVLLSPGGDIKLGLCVICIGVVYSLGMTFLTAYSEKNSSESK